jgi:hypothetical protein
MTIVSVKPRTTPACTITFITFVVTFALVVAALGSLDVVDVVTMTVIAFMLPFFTFAITAQSPLITKTCTRHSLAIGKVFTRWHQRYEALVRRRPETRFHKPSLCRVQTVPDVVACVGVCQLALFVNANENMSIERIYVCMKMQFAKIKVARLKFEQH